MKYSFMQQIIIEHYPVASAMLGDRISLVSHN